MAFGASISVCRVRAKPFFLIADNRSYSALTSFIRDRAASSSEMLAIFGDDALLRAALAFEAALAHAEAEEGLISKSDAAWIGDACTSMTVDAAAIAEEAAHAGTLAIPLVRRLRAEVAQYDATAAGL